MNRLKSEVPDTRSCSRYPSPTREVGTHVSIWALRCSLAIADVRIVNSAATDTAGEGASHARRRSGLGVAPGHEWKPRDAMIAGGRDRRPQSAHFRALRVTAVTAERSTTRLFPQPPLRSDRPQRSAADMEEEIVSADLLPVLLQGMALGLQPVLHAGSAESLRPQTRHARRAGAPGGDHLLVLRRRHDPRRASGLAHCSPPFRPSRTWPAGAAPHLSWSSAPCS